MIKKTARIINKLGLHARPSAILVTATTRFKSEFFFSKDDLRVNGKSIMGVMMLAAEMGSQLVVEADGPDEEEAMAEILRVIASGFGENT
ncbi:MAG: HPr family phosphocarrier protein [Candidatus Zixiibacteriota bacterium]|nr:MAG: HPr family phosphocarrier protein [candidate division Zixibacteria bacterium]